IGSKQESAATPTCSRMGRRPSASADDRHALARSGSSGSAPRAASQTRWSSQAGRRQAGSEVRSHSYTPAGARNRERCSPFEGPSSGVPVGLSGHEGGATAPSARPESPPPGKRSVRAHGEPSSRGRSCRRDVFYDAAEYFAVIVAAPGEHQARGADVDNGAAHHSVLAIELGVAFCDEGDAEPCGDRLKGFLGAVSGAGDVSRLGAFVLGEPEGTLGAGLFWQGDERLVGQIAESDASAFRKPRAPGGSHVAWFVRDGDAPESVGVG